MCTLDLIKAFVAYEKHFAAKNDWDQSIAKILVYFGYRDICLVYQTPVSEIIAKELIRLEFFTDVE